MCKRDKIAKLKSGLAPQLVTVLDNSEKYKCNDKCTQYKSVQISSHITAAAEVNGELQTFLDQYTVTFGKRGKQSKTQKLNLPDQKVHTVFVTYRRKKMDEL